MAQAEERFTVGRMFTAYLDAAAQLGLRADVERTSPDLAQHYAKPPLPTARIPGSLCDKLYVVVEKLRGRPAVRSMGRIAMRDEGMKLVGSLLENTFQLFGRTPDAVFSNVATVMSPIVGNVDISWTAQGPRGGVVTIRPQGQPTPLAYAMYEGYFEHFLGVAGAVGEVDDAQLAPDLRSAVIAVRW